MEIVTIQKYIHTSPRKLRLVADMVRKMEPAKAVDILRLTPKMAAKDLEKALSTVLANAKVAGADTSKLAFRKIEINESTKMRRFRAGTRGRVKPFKRRMAHIKIVLSDELVQQDSERLRKPESQKVRKSSDTPKLRSSETPSSSEKKEEVK